MLKSSAGLIAASALLLSAGSVFAGTPNQKLIDAGATGTVSLASSAVVGTSSAAGGATSAPTSTALTRDARLQGGLTGTVEVRSLTDGRGEIVLRSSDIDRDDQFTVSLYRGGGLPVTADRLLHWYTREGISRTSDGAFVIEMTAAQLQMWDDARTADGATIKVVDGPAHGAARFAK